MATTRARRVCIAAATSMPAGTYTSGSPLTGTAFTQTGDGTDIEVTIVHNSGVSTGVTVVFRTRADSGDAWFERQTVVLPATASTTFRLTFEVERAVQWDVIAYGNLGGSATCGVIGSERIPG